jgi:hypothetical protein
MHPGKIQSKRQEYYNITLENGRRKKRTQATRHWRHDWRWTIFFPLLVEWFTIKRATFRETFNSLQSSLSSLPIINNSKPDGCHIATTNGTNLDRTREDAHLCLGGHLSRPAPLERGSTRRHVNIITSSPVLAEANIAEIDGSSKRLAWASATIATRYVPTTTMLGGRYDITI